MRFFLISVVIVGVTHWDALRSTARFISDDFANRNAEAARYDSVVDTSEDDRSRYIQYHDGQTGNHYSESGNWAVPDYTGHYCGGFGNSVGNLAPGGGQFGQPGHVLGEGTGIGHGHSQGTDIGHGSSQGANFGHGPSQGADFGHGPSQGADFGHGPSQGADFGRGPSQGADFGHGPSQGADFGHGISSGANVGHLDANQGRGAAQIGRAGTGGAKTSYGYTIHHDKHNSESGVREISQPAPTRSISFQLE